ncbi:MAG: sigma-54 dependent transcriptional regulator [Paludibacter sp.]|nr:sigma-54 dependent transcriptional regulator [Paludibacter sp.]
MAKILVIDDERSIRNTLKDILEFEKHQVTVAENGKIGLEAAQNAVFDLIFSDIKMPEMDGIELLANLMEKEIEAPIVMISGHGNIETAVECIKKGAFDFIEKPIDLNRLLITVRNALDRNNLVVETKTLKKKVAKRHQMIGASSAIEKVRMMIERVAPTDARVLITGDNGTGKEVVARLLYEQSNRTDAAFVEVNCAAIPSELIESELFGHEKGAFTSAIKQRIGKFEQADGGTIFLDEIGDMSLSAQTKVLRVLQESELTRVGSDKSIKVNVRVFAATNKDLKAEIEKGNFREDLFHRLNVIPIHVPSLDERKNDIPLLITHFCELICNEQGRQTKIFEEDGIELLKSRSWTGNIRELRNVVERLIILGGNTISKEDIEMFAL